MTIEEKNGEDKLVLYISGRIDTSTAPELDAFISGKLDRTEELVLDFTEVQYISSAGLRVLLSAYKAMEKKKGSMVIRGVNKEIEETLYITGFLEFLTVEGARRKGEST